MTDAERLAVLRAVAAAQTDPRTLFELVAATLNDDEAERAVMAHLGVGRTEALAVLDMQLRRHTVMAARG